MTISPARKIAFDVLLRVTTQDAYADEALRALLVKTVSVEDAGLATELSLGTLRWQRLLDFLIDSHLTKSSKSLDPEVRISLRLGVYQLYFFTRVPAHAAVHESVELVKLARKRSAAPLVNAVLRKIAKESALKKSARDTVTELSSGRDLTGRTPGHSILSSDLAGSNAGCVDSARRELDPFSKQTTASPLSRGSSSILSIVRKRCPHYKMRDAW
jgi:transcription termination factor NusB